jgi:GNAT superfamily N-acetyltransferase
LYNGAFRDVWGFVPITWEEFATRAEEFRPFYRPELVLIAEVDGAPAGFGLVLPDINAALRNVGGRLLPFGWLRLLWEVPRLRTGRFILAGVLPQFTGLGVAAILAHAMDGTARRMGLESAELSLVQRGNTRMRHVIESFGCRPGKTYRLYQRSL